MKKGLLLTICVGLVLFTAVNSHAVPVYWDVSAAGSAGFYIPPGTPGFPAGLGDANTLTGIFNQIGFDSQTTTIQYDTDGSGGPLPTINDRFLDAGNLKANGLIYPTQPDEEGMNLVYEVTALWSNVTGYVTGVGAAGADFDTRIDLRYDGGTINFYLDTVLDSAFADPFPATSNPVGAGGTGFGASATSTLIGSLTLLEGIGHTFVDFNGGDLQNQGSVELLLQFDSMLAGFWFDENGKDLSTNDPIIWNLLTTDMNIDTPIRVPGQPTAAGDLLYTAYSNQNGSAELSVVPEPSTILLLGGGLIGLAFISRRKSRAKG